MPDTQELTSLKGRKKHTVSLPPALFAELEAISEERGVCVSDILTEAAIVTLSLTGRIPPETFEVLGPKLYGVSEKSFSDRSASLVKAGIRAAVRLRKEQDKRNSKKPTRLQSGGSQEGGLESA